MRDAYRAVESARKSKDHRGTMAAIKNLWGKYGEVLHKKLVMSQDPEILFRAQEEGDEDCKKYVAHMEGFTYKRPFNAGEIEEYAYIYRHSGFTWNPYEHLRYVRFNPSS